MIKHFKFQLVFSFDEAIPEIHLEAFIISKMVEKGFSVSKPHYQQDNEYIGIYKDKISDK